jgi:hypothetical protein
VLQRVYPEALEGQSYVRLLQAIDHIPGNTILNAIPQPVARAIGTNPKSQEILHQVWQHLAIALNDRPAEIERSEAEYQRKIGVYIRDDSGRETWIPDMGESIEAVLDGGGIWEAKFNDVRVDTETHQNISIKSTRTHQIGDGRAHKEVNEAVCVLSGESLFHMFEERHRKKIEDPHLNALFAEASLMRQNIHLTIQQALKKGTITELLAGGRDNLFEGVPEEMVKHAFREMADCNSFREFADTLAEPPFTDPKMRFVRYCFNEGLQKLHAPVRQLFDEHAYGKKIGASVAGKVTTCNIFEINPKPGHSNLGGDFEILTWANTQTLKLQNEAANGERAIVGAHDFLPQSSKQLAQAILYANTWTTVRNPELGEEMHVLHPEAMERIRRVVVTGFSWGGLKAVGVLQELEQLLHDGNYILPDSKQVMEMFPERHGKIYTDMPVEEWAQQNLQANGIGYVHLDHRGDYLDVKTGRMRNPYREEFVGGPNVIAYAAAIQPLTKEQSHYRVLRVDNPQDGIIQGLCGCDIPQERFSTDRQLQVHCVTTYGNMMGHNEQEMFKEMERKMQIVRTRDANDPEYQAAVRDGVLEYMERINNIYQGVDTSLRIGFDVRQENGRETIAIVMDANSTGMREQLESYFGITLGQPTPAPVGDFSHQPMMRLEITANDHGLDAQALREHMIEVMRHYPSDYKAYDVETHQVRGREQAILRRIDLAGNPNPHYAIGVEVQQDEVVVAVPADMPEEVLQALVNPVADPEILSEETLTEEAAAQMPNPEVQLEALPPRAVPKGLEDKVGNLKYFRIIPTDGNIMTLNGEPLQEYRGPSTDDDIRPLPAAGQMILPHAPSQHSPHPPQGAGASFGEPNPDRVVPPEVLAELIKGRLQAHPQVIEIRDAALPQVQEQRGGGILR